MYSVISVSNEGRFICPHLIYGDLRKVVSKLQSISHDFTVFPQSPTEFLR